MNKEIPIQPIEELEADDQNYDQVWNLMKRCWDYDSQNRPDCTEIQSLVTQIGIPDNRALAQLKTGDALNFWQAMRKGPEVDYDVVSETLLRVSCALTTSLERESGVDVNASSIMDLLGKQNRKPTTKTCSGIFSFTL